MTGPGRRFDPSELHDADGTPLTDAESAALLSTARDLEAFVRTESIAPTGGFEDRVMAAIAAEPPPRAVASGGWLAGFVVVVRDAWRITLSGGGRPVAVRAQAFALVLLVVVAFGSLGTVAAVGVSRLLTGDPTTPPTTAPSVDPSIPQPTPSVPPPSTGPSPMPSPPSPSPSAGESEEPGESSQASESPDGTDDSGGTSGATASPRPTSGATDTPEPTDDDDDETPEPTDDDDDKTPKPSETPDPDDTPDPDETPDPSDD